ncbi:hypothetical protein ACWC10_34550 [Streptomyces sp. NPDC001595]
MTPSDEGAEAFRAAALPHLRAIRELFLDPLTEQQIAAAGDAAAALRAWTELHRNR